MNSAPVAGVIARAIASRSSDSSGPGITRTTVPPTASTASAYIPKAGSMMTASERWPGGDGRLGEPALPIAASATPDSRLPTPVWRN